DWKKLTADNPESDDSPRFTPDGRAVLFSRGIRPHGLSEFPKLMRADLATGKITRLLADVDLAAQDWHFSPDGKALYFSAEDRARTKIFRAAADGTGATAIVSDG